MADHLLPESYLATALKWFVPLLTNIMQHQKGANKPILVGINGAQGSGKSTLSDLLVHLLNKQYGLPSISFSIDDYYLSKQDRFVMSENVHPLFKTRGVPGTHDTKALQYTLKKLLNGETCAISRFDKSTDDLYPKSQWQRVTAPVSIIILEGWCVGVKPQADDKLTLPINSLEQTKDEKGLWRGFVNNALKQQYATLFNTIDYMIMLKAPSFNQVHTWRCEQEQRLRDKLIKQGRDKNDLGGLMDNTQIASFIQYYQRVTEHALISLPKKCNTYFELDANRSITRAINNSMSS